MHVFDGDPARLDWRSNSKEKTTMVIHGHIEESREGRRPPTDRELSKFMEKAKAFSINELRSVFVVLIRSKNDIDSKPVPFIEYYKGKLVAFCRPPWRQGRGM